MVWKWRRCGKAASFLWFWWWIWALARHGRREIRHDGGELCDITLDIVECCRSFRLVQLEAAAKLHDRPWKVGADTSLQLVVVHLFVAGSVRRLRFFPRLVDGGGVYLYPFGGGGGALA